MDREKIIKEWLNTKNPIDLNYIGAQDDLGDICLDGDFDLNKLADMFLQSFKDLLESKKKKPTIEQVTCEESPSNCLPDGSCKDKHRKSSIAQVDIDYNQIINDLLTDLGSKE